MGVLRSLPLARAVRLLRRLYLSKLPAIGHSSKMRRRYKENTWCQLMELSDGITTNWIQPRQGLGKLTSLTNINLDLVSVNTT